MYYQSAPFNRKNSITNVIYLFALDTLINRYEMYSLIEGPNSKYSKGEIKKITKTLLIINSKSEIDSVRNNNLFFLINNDSLRLNDSGLIWVTNGHFVKFNRISQEIYSHYIH